MPLGLINKQTEGDGYPKSADDFEHMSFYMAYSESVSNLPANTEIAFVFTLRAAYRNKGYGMQISINYFGNGLYTRIHKDGGWSPWTAVS